MEYALTVFFAIVLIFIIVTIALFFLLRKLFELKQIFKEKWVDHIDNKDRHNWVRHDFVDPVTLDMRYYYKCNKCGMETEQIILSHSDEADTFMESLTNLHPPYEYGCWLGDEDEELEP